MLLAPILLSVLPTIWIVDGSSGPGTNFTDIPPAVAAAVSGDTILVRPGVYSHFSVSGKSLTIRGAGAGSTIVQLIAPGYPSLASSTVLGIPSGGWFPATVYLSGLRFNAIQPAGYAGFGVSGPGTRVVLADVMAFGCPCVNGAVGFHGLLITNGAVVHAARCSFTGGICSGTGIGQHGASVQSTSFLAADACTFTAGGPSTLSWSGAGLVADGGFVTLSHCSAIGANNAGAGSGGAGVAVTGVGFAAGAFARIAGDSTSLISGGTGNPNWYSVAVSSTPSEAFIHGPVQLQGPITGPVTTGAPALPYVSVAGSVTPAGELLAAQPVTMTIQSVLPSAPFACLVSLTPGFSTAFSSLLVGELLVPVQTPIAFQGTLDGLGTASFTAVPAASIPSLVDLPLYVQVGVLDAAANKVRMSNCWIGIFKP